ncbi:MAG: glycosyltransferase [Dehalococcoidia bacterium]|nr:MAG: glycosyltransferase [Dehalococcoidia bacterium]
MTINILLNLRSIKPPQSNSKIVRTAPFVSVLIPARDEENNIAICLESLRKQDYPNFEILVLNDNSSDSTASIVTRIAAEDNRIKLFFGEQLPKGWTGKPFACYQLAKQAAGSWLLFVDADTIHAPDMLRYVMSQALKLKPSLLSGFPRQITDSIPQKITIPLIYFIIFSLFPLWWFKQFKKPKPSMAIGQFLLFSRDEYWKIGGHAAVKSRILEDIWLGIEITKHGGRHLATDLSSVVSCNMYSTLDLMWQGLTRCIYSVAAISTLALIGLLIIGYFLFLAPFYWIWNVLFIDTSLALQAIVMSQVAIILAMRWFVDSHYKASIISTPLHPIGLLIIILICVRAIAKQLVGASVAWKNRLYSKESTVE